MHAVDLLDAPKDEVADVEGRFFNTAIMIAWKLLVVTGLPHDSSKPLFFKVVGVDTMCLLGFSFLVELYACSSEGDVGG
jgi:hypothetical protein